MAHLVCVSCKMQMKPEKNGVYFIEYAGFGPYKIWHTDKLKCPRCGATILTGFGDTAIHHHDSIFNDLLELARKQSDTVEEVR